MMKGEVRQVIVAKRVKIEHQPYLLSLGVIQQLCGPNFTEF